MFYGAAILDSDDIQTFTFGLLARWPSALPEQSGSNAVRGLDEISNCDGQIGVAAPCRFNDRAEPLDSDHGPRFGAESLVVDVPRIEKFLHAAEVPAVEGSDHLMHDLCSGHGLSVRRHVLDPISKDRCHATGFSATTWLPHQNQAWTTLMLMTGQQDDPGQDSPGLRSLPHTATAPAPLLRPPGGTY